MSEEKKPVQACIIFAAGITSSPIVKVEEIISTRVAGGLFLPSVSTKTVVHPSEGDPTPPREMQVLFPLVVLDAPSRETIEVIREMLHKKIDDNFDSFLSSYQVEGDGDDSKESN